MMSKFLRGAMSGLFSGTLMMGIVGLVSLTGVIGFMGIPAAAGMVLCTSLFGGIMSVMRGGGEGQSAAADISTAEALTPVISQSISRAPQVSADVAEEVAPARTDGKSWAETAGRSAGSQSQINSILANGAMSDKDRASAILASRENDATAELAR